MSVPVRLSVCPQFVQAISQTIHRIVFKFHIGVLQILQICIVNVLIEKIENCRNYRVLNINEDLVHIHSMCTFAQAVSRLFIESFLNFI